MGKLENYCLVTQFPHGRNSFVICFLVKFLWEDNIKMDLQEVGCGGMDWIKLAQVRDRWWALVTVVMNLQVPQNAGNFLTS